MKATYISQLEKHAQLAIERLATKRLKDLKAYTKETLQDLMDSKINDIEEIISKEEIEEIVKG